jgi:hypothetical protein
MRHLVKTAALALLPLFLGGHAQAAENEAKVITLSCDATLTRTYGANKPAEPEPLQKIGAVVNLDEQTVFFLGYVVPIESVDEASILDPTKPNNPNIAALRYDLVCATNSVF